MARFYSATLARNLSAVDSLNGAQAAVVGDNDAIYMSAGSKASETLTNAGLQDTYVYQQQFFGKSTINGLTSHEAMQLSNNDFVSTLDLFNNGMSQVGANVVIQVDANDQITLANVQKSSLSQSQFTLV